MQAIHTRTWFVGKDVGDVYNDVEGMQNMCNLGVNIVWLLKMTNQG